jgi:hypothetical protein
MPPSPTRFLSEDQTDLIRLTRTRTRPDPIRPIATSRYIGENLTKRNYFSPFLVLLIFYLVFVGLLDSNNAYLTIKKCTFCKLYLHPLIICFQVVWY